MKKVLVPVIALLVIFASWASFQAASAQSSACPSWLTIEGLCLDQSQISIENISAPSGDYVTIDTDYSPDKWLVQAAITPPYEFSLIVKKYEMVPVAVFVDQRLLQNPPLNEGQIFDGVYVFAKLVCSEYGSAQPSMSFTMPRQNTILANGWFYHRVPRSISLHIVNWETFSDCRD